MPTSDPWYWALLGSPYVSGALGWAGLLLAFVGFGLSLWQLHKVRTAAEAARDAAKALTLTVRAREKLLHLNAAQAHIESARDRLGYGSRESATLCIDLSITSVIAAQELSGDDDGRALRKLLIGLQKRNEELDSIGDLKDKRNGYVGVVSALRTHVDDIKRIAVKHRYTYEESNKQNV